jgi:hypothetical protein
LERSVRAWIISATCIVLLICGACVQTTLAADDFEPRSRLLSGRAVATNYAMTLADLGAMTEAAKKKFGPGASTSFNSGTGRVVTMVDGKVVATAEIKARVQDVFGIFLIGPRRDDMARFPFAMKVSGKRDGHRDVGQMVRARFAKQAPQLFNFNDFDWVTLWCWSQDQPDAGAQFADAPPRLGRVDLCLVRWRRDEPKTMLIGAVAADGGYWVRDVSRTICRTLAAQWIDMPETKGRDREVDYVACVLVHDPDRGTRGARDTVVEHFYEVRPHHRLLSIN